MNEQFKPESTEMVKFVGNTRKMEEDIEEHKRSSNKTEPAN